MVFRDPCATAPDRPPWSTYHLQVQRGGFDLVGDITIRGTTKEVVLRVEGPTPIIKDMQGNRRFGATASVTINRMDYGVKWNGGLEAGGVVVSPEIQINIELEAVEKKG